MNRLSQRWVVFHFVRNVDKNDLLRIEEATYVHIIERSRIEN